MAGDTAGSDQKTSTEADTDAHLKSAAIWLVKLLSFFATGEYMKPQALLIDLDDTLIEYSVYYEEATKKFIDFLNHSTLQPPQIQSILDAIDGYGVATFIHALQTVYLQLAERAIEEKDMLYVRQLGKDILNQPVQVRSGVAETLEYLFESYPLTLLTKGERNEQEQKIQKSGLAQYFQEIIITTEKSTTLYHQIVSASHREAQATWMIGDSPKSDVVPALLAGLQVAFIPHPRTWSREIQEIPDETERLLVLKQFSDLRGHF